jgi:outer membrane receptor for ferric coprogen and ferric-rhodotorulic acid
MARYDLTEQLSLQLNIDNLSNEEYIKGIYFGQIYFGEPLTIKGKLTYQF